MPFRETAVKTVLWEAALEGLNTISLVTILRRLGEKDPVAPACQGCYRNRSISTPVYMYMDSLQRSATQGMERTTERGSQRMPKAARTTRGQSHLVHKEGMCDQDSDIHTGLPPSFTHALSHTEGQTQIGRDRETWRSSLHDAKARIHHQVLDTSLEGLQEP